MKKKNNSEAQNFFNALKDNPDKITAWCKKEIAAYEDLIKLVDGDHGCDIESKPCKKCAMEREKKRKLIGICHGENIFEGDGFCTSTSMCKIAEKQLLEIKGYM